MSFVRVNRYSPRGGGRKALKVKKKKTAVKQEWDVSLGGGRSNGILLWRNRCADMALVTQNGTLNRVQHAIGWNGFLGMLHSRSWREEQNPLGSFF